MEFYDVGTSDLRELWESYLAEPGLGQDVSLGSKEEEWGNVLCVRDKSSLGVVLRDRLMTDAALGGPRLIKSEHSYSLLASSPPPSPVTPGANPHTPNSGSSADAVPVSLANTSSSIDPSNLEHHKSLDIRGRMDDMEEECFPVISMNASTGRSELSSSSSTTTTTLPASSTSTIILKRTSNLVPEDVECVEIKGEPLSAPNSPSESCHTTIVDDKSTITMVFPQSLHFPKNHMSQTSDSEEDDEEYYQMEKQVSIPDADVTSITAEPPKKRNAPRGLGSKQKKQEIFTKKKNITGMTTIQERSINELREKYSTLSTCESLTPLDDKMIREIKGRDDVNRPPLEILISTAVIPDLVQETVRYLTSQKVEIIPGD
ncbi:cyclic-AMP response element binding protein A isoform X4 [Augochlora pura]